MIALQYLKIHARLVIEAVREACGNNADQILVAHIVLTQQHQMIIAVLSLGKLPVKAGTRCQIDLTAKNGMNSLLQRFLIKIDHAVHHAVIGDGQRIHPQLLYPLEHLRDLAGAIQKTVAGMGMQVCKAHSFGHPFIKNRAPDCSGAPQNPVRLSLHLLLREDKHQGLSGPHPHHLRQPKAAAPFRC